MRKLLFATSILLAGTAYAELPKASQALEAFIQEYAPTNIAWQKDIQLLRDGEPMPQGRLQGKSSYFGYYSYKPAAWDELSQDERNNLLRDDRLRGWLSYYGTKFASTSEIGRSKDATAPMLPKPDIIPYKSEPLINNAGRFTYIMSVDEVRNQSPVYIKLADTPYINPTK